VSTSQKSRHAEPWLEGHFGASSALMMPSSVSGPTPGASRPETRARHTTERSQAEESVARQHPSVSPETAVLTQYVESPRGIQASNDPTVILPSGVWMPDLEGMHFHEARAFQQSNHRAFELPCKTLGAPEGAWLPEHERSAPGVESTGLSEELWKIGDRPPTPPPINSLEHAERSGIGEGAWVGMEHVLVSQISDVPTAQGQNADMEQSLPTESGGVSGPRVTAPRTRGLDRGVGVEASLAPAIRAIAGGDDIGLGLVTEPSMHKDLHQGPAMMLRQQLNSRAGARSPVMRHGQGGLSETNLISGGRGDFYVSGLQVEAKTATDQKSIALEGALPPLRVDTDNFRPINSGSKRPPRDMSSRSRTGFTNSRSGRRSPSPSFRSASPARSWNGSVVSGNSHGSSRSQLDMMRFQTYDGRPRGPRSRSDSKDFGSLLANPVQPYTPGAALRGSTAVSPLTTPRQEDDSFHSHDFQDWMGAQRPQPPSPRMAATSHFAAAAPMVSLTPRLDLGDKQQVPTCYAAVQETEWSVANATPSKPSQASNPTAAGPMSWLTAAKQEFQDQAKPCVFSEASALTSPPSPDSAYGTWEGDLQKMGWGSYQSARRFGPRPAQHPHDKARLLLDLRGTGAARPYNMSPNPNAGRERHW